MIVINSPGHGCSVDVHLVIRLPPRRQVNKCGSFSKESFIGTIRISLQSRPTIGVYSVPTCCLLTQPQVCNFVHQDVPRLMFRGGKLVGTDCKFSTAYIGISYAHVPTRIPCPTIEALRSHNVNYSLVIANSTPQWECLPLGGGGLAC